MIPASTLVSPQLWAEATFGTVELGDPRRKLRALRIAEALATDPGASLPKQMHRAADLEATYRFVHAPDVSYDQLIRPHLEATQQQCREQSQVLLIQDTTEVDYHQHPKTTGLGPIGNGNHHGFLLQTVLAVVPSTSRVLGLAHQEPFLRQPAPAKETKQQRQQRERESQVWERSVQALGSPPQDTHWIHVGDRYSDIFAFLWLCRDRQCDFLVRAAQDRCVDLLVEQAETPVPPRSHHPEHPSPPAQHLFEEVYGWAAQASSEIQVDATQKHAARTAQVVLSWRPLRLLPPRSQQAQHWHPLVVWVIRVWEPAPPRGVEPLEWVLLSSVPTQTAEQAQERVEWYDGRGLPSRPQNGLSDRAAPPARLRGLAHLVGLALAGGGPAHATASGGPADPGAIGKAGLANRGGAGGGAPGTAASRDDEHAAVLAHHCSLRRLPGPQERWPAGLEDPVARMVVCPHLAGRRSSCFSTLK
jgi:Transposase DNA-binding